MAHIARSRLAPSIEQYLQLYFKIVVSYYSDITIRRAGLPQFFVKLFTPKPLHLWPIENSAELFELGCFRPYLSRLLWPNIDSFNSPIPITRVTKVSLCCIQNTRHILGYSRATNSGVWREP